MPFFSALAELDTTRKTDALAYQDDRECWEEVSVCNGLSLWFAIGNPGTFGRIIQALTGSNAFHVETRIEWDAVTWVSDDRLAAALDLALSRLGQPYDFEAIFTKAINEESTYHTPGKEFCSGYAWEIVSYPLPGLRPYPTPGFLRDQVIGMLGLPQPKRETPAIEIGDAEIEFLQSLAGNKLATGTVQRVLRELEQRV